MTRGQKITLFLPDLGGGGAERVMVALANVIAARGIETTLIAGRAEGPYLGEVDGPVRLVDLCVSQIRRALPSLIRHMNNAKPDAVLSALTHANLTVLVAAKLARHRPRIVVAEHNSTKMLMHGNHLPKRVLKRLMIRMLYPTADDIVLVSREMRSEFADFISLPDERFRSIHNPIIPKKAQSEAATNGQRHLWLQEKTTPVIVGAGRLSTQKDFPTLLRAFAILAERSPARLIVFGEGPDRPMLETLRADLGLEDRVDFPGFVDALGDQLAASDLFAMSSLWEGFPMVLLEALAVGTPVVVTDCPTGPSEILEDANWGRLVPVRDPEKLAEAMLDMLHHPVNVPMDDVFARFRIDGVVDQYLSILLPGWVAHKEADV